MQELIIKGLSDAQINRILNDKSITETDIAYANIRCIVFAQTGSNAARILFDNRSEWNHKFEGNSDDFLRIISGE